MVPKYLSIYNGVMNRQLCYVTVYRGNEIEFNYTFSGESGTSAYKHDDWNVTWFERMRLCDKCEFLYTYSLIILFEKILK